MQNNITTTQIQLQYAQISNLIAQSHNIIKPIDNVSLILFGNTGSGKSTFANLLLGHTLILDKYQGFPVWQFKSQQNNQFFTICHDLEHSTIIPKQLKFQFDNQMYGIIDIAGFFDNRKNVQKVVISYSHYLILKTINKFKIFLFIQFGTLKSRLIQTRIQPLKSLLKILQLQNVQNDFNQFCNCISLVITKIDKLNEDDIKLKLLETANFFQKKIESENKKIAIALKNISKRIFLFQQPNQQRKQIKLNYQKLRNILNQSKVYQTNYHKLNCVIDKQCKEFVNQILKLLQNFVNKFLEVIKKVLKQTQTKNENDNFLFWDLLVQSCKQNFKIFNEKNLAPLPQKKSNQYFNYLTFFDEVLRLINQFSKMGDQAKQQMKNKNQQFFNKIKEFVDVICIYLATNENDKIKWRQFKFQLNKLEYESTFFYQIILENFDPLGYIFIMKNCQFNKQIHKLKALKYTIKKDQPMQYYKIALTHFERQKYTQVQFNNHLSQIYFQLGKIQQNQTDKLKYLIKALKYNQKWYETKNKESNLFQNENLLNYFAKFLITKNYMQEALILFRGLNNNIEIIECYKRMIQINQNFQNHVKFGQFYKSILLIENAKQQFLYAKQVANNQEQKIQSLNLLLQADDIAKYKSIHAEKIRKKEIYNKINIDELINSLQKKIK